MATLLVATTGGHLAQLVDIANRLPDDGDDVRVWVTHDNSQSRSALAGERTVFVPYVGAKDVAGVLRNIPEAGRLVRDWQFTRAISTGSALAVAYLPYCAARGVRASYIESATRIDGPSLTGRLLQRLPGVRLYTQYDSCARGRWRYAGSVFDGFTRVDSGASGAIRRAVVSLGTAEEFPFRRMLDALMPLLGPGGEVERRQGFPVETLWQTGCSAVEGLAIDAQPFVAAGEMDAALRASDLVVTHAGTGSALSALRAGRFPLLVPRDPARGELCDDHQDRFARDVDARGLARRRAPSDLCADDLFFAASKRIERASSPPAFALEP
jgi:UDP-N-acetylglucosamine--N-acetylmuramyl-(pentapeptide) pyrophosphoryl-undecaprenol N-acetylglucosamine transferase